MVYPAPRLPFRRMGGWDIAGVAAVAGVAVAFVSWRWPVSTRPPPWSLTWLKGSAYSLRNERARAALDVRFDVGEASRKLTRNTGPWDRIESGAAVEVIVMTAWQVPDPTVTVSWKRRRVGRRGVWHSPLPPH